MHPSRQTIEAVTEDLLGACDWIERKIARNSKKQAKTSTNDQITSVHNDPENDDDVKRKTAQKKGPISTDTPSSKFESPNPFEPLAKSIDMETVGEELVDHADSSPKLNTTKDKPVSVTLKLTQNWKEIVEKIDTITTEKVGKRMFKEFIKFYSSSVADYRALQKYFSESKFEYFGLPLKSEGPLKIVIKGIPRDSTISEIKTELSNIGINVHSVAQLKNFKLKEPLPIFLVHIFRNGASSPFLR